MGSNSLMVPPSNGMDLGLGSHHGGHHLLNISRDVSEILHQVTGNAEDSEMPLETPLVVKFIRSESFVEDAMHELEEMEHLSIPTKRKRHLLRSGECMGYIVFVVCYSMLAFFSMGNLRGIFNFMQTASIRDSLVEISNVHDDDRFEEISNPHDIFRYIKTTVLPFLLSDDRDIEQGTFSVFGSGQIFENVFVWKFGACLQTCCLL